MKLKVLHFIAFLIFSNTYAQLELDNLNLINDNYQIEDSVLSDIDNDGYKDLVSSGVICDRTGSKQTVVTWQKNDHFGNFEVRNILFDFSWQIGNILEIDSKDIDNDGDNDIVFEYNNNFNVIRNNNNGTFGTIETYGFTSDEVDNFYLIDLDNDGYDDIVYRNDFELIKIKWNLTNGQFSSSYTNGSADIKFKLVDINNDNLLDFVIDNNSNFSLKINQGNRSFNTISSININHDFDFDFGDFNNDNLKDLVASYNGKLTIYFNQGISSQNNIFSTTNSNEIFSGNSSTFYGIKVADFNNDTFNDIAFSSLNDRLIIENNNNTSFLNHYSFNGNVGLIDAIDLNNDGLLDLINNEYGFYNLYFINHDNFNFQFKNYSSNSLSSTHTIADLNNDGFKDIVSFSYEATSGYNIQYLINQGNNDFLRKVIPINNAESLIRTNVKPLVFDIDNDNLKDILFIRNDASTIDKILWIKNLGNETFDETFNISETGFYTVNPNNTKMFFGDFDNDNDNDLFLSYQFYENVNGQFQNAVSLDTDQYHRPQIIFNSDNNTIINVIAKKVITVGVTEYMSLKWFKYDSQRNLISSNTISYYNMVNVIGGTCENINNMVFLDFDNDGFKDIVYSVSCDSSFSPHDFVILKNNGNDTFQNPEILIPRSNFVDEGRYTDFDIVDIDNDNDIDIIETQYKQYTSLDISKSKIHYNENGSFNNRETLFTYVIDDRCEDLIINISIEDFDNDGVLDLLKANPYEYLITNLSEYNVSLGLSENSFETNFKVFPNPTNAILNINSKLEISKIEVYNNLGEITLFEFNKSSIDLSALNPGFYFIKIKDQIGNSETKKIIKK